MKRIRVYKQGVEVQSATFDDDETKNAWVTLLANQAPWGKPERWVNGFDLSDEEKASALESREVENGLGDKIVEFKLPSQFSIIEENIDAEINQQIAKKERLSALKDKAAAYKSSDLDTVVELRQAYFELLEILGLK